MGQALDIAHLFCRSCTATSPRIKSVAPDCFRQVRGLLFDMGDVLYDATVWRRWLVQLLARMGWTVEYHSFFHLWDTQFLVDVHRGERDYADAFEEFLLSVGLSRPLVEEVEAASQARQRELAETLRPLPGVRETIAQLQARGFVLGVLSDSESPAHVLRARLDRLGLAGRFTTIVSSIELGRTKPAAICYQTALNAMQLTAEQVAFVGHDQDELCGAAAANMPTVAFNYQPEAEADLYIERFDELLSLAPPSQLATAG